MLINLIFADECPCSFQDWDIKFELCSQDEYAQLLQEEAQEKQRVQNESTEQVRKVKVYVNSPDIPSFQNFCDL